MGMPVVDKDAAQAIVDSLHAEIADLKRQLELQLAVMKDINVRTVRQYTALRDQNAKLRSACKQVVKAMDVITSDEGDLVANLAECEEFRQVLRAALRETSDESEVGDAND